jgi:uncharacterized membrane protein
LSLVLPLVRSLALLLPPTIHPMLVHFPIVFLYLTAAIDVLAMTLPDRDRFLQRCGFFSLTLACFFTVLTMAMGFVSEQSVHFTPALRAILEAHQHFAVLTGLAEGAAWLLQVFTRFPDGPGWTLFGRGRATWPSTFLVVAAAVSVTVTASLGGRMVYDHGAGVLGVTRTRA